MDRISEEITAPNFPNSVKHRNLHIQKGSMIPEQRDMHKDTLKSNCWKTKIKS